MKDSTDIVVVGAGLAGISTAFFLLKNSKLSISILKDDKQTQTSLVINTSLEESFQNIVKISNIKNLKYSLKVIANSWHLLKSMYRQTHLSVPCQAYSDFTGYSRLPDINNLLEETLLKKSLGISVEKIFISQQSYLSKSLPKKYDSIVIFVDQKIINKNLKTTGFTFQAQVKSKYLSINLDLFCQELTKYLLQKYPDRFKLYSLSTDCRFTHQKDKVQITQNTHKIICKRCIFCTETSLNKITKKYIKVRKQIFFGKLNKSKNLKPLTKQYVKESTQSISRHPYSSLNLFTYTDPSLRTKTNFSPKLFKKPDYKWTHEYIKTSNNLGFLGQIPSKPNYYLNLIQANSQLSKLGLSFRLSQLILGQKLNPTIFDTSK